jgi:guanosine-3',5'-bis(diphosphate) 3'-pyrophosphohydrolase
MAAQNATTRLVLDAVAFAARAHQGQLRKDGKTPYASHPFRVCLIVRDIFGIDDPRVLAAAVLHDTIEDTTTDFDDLAKHFGREVAEWVAQLSKDKRLQENGREQQYVASLAAAGWQVQVCKLGDVCDNLLDLDQMPTEKRSQSLNRARTYLEALRASLKPEAHAAYEMVAEVYRKARSPK